MVDGLAVRREGAVQADPKHYTVEFENQAAVELAIKQHHPEIVSAMFQPAPDGIPEQEWEQLRKQLRMEEAGQGRLIYDDSSRSSAEEREKLLASIVSMSEAELQPLVGNYRYAGSG